MLYQVFYDRDDSQAATYRAQNLPYSAGEYRVITLLADSEAEALAIAEARLAKQYPESRYQQVDGEQIRVDGVEIGDVHRPDLAQSNYVLREIVALET